MTFIDAIRSGFNNYVTFTGRASRSEYFYWTLFVIILSIISLIIDQVAFPYSGWSPTNSLTALITFLPGLAVSIRRLHDVNRSGWWLLLSLTGIGLLILLYWVVKKSADGENSYGYLE